MSKSGGVLLMVLGALTACGGEGTHSADQPNGAGNASGGGATQPSAGSNTGGKSNPSGGGRAPMAGAGGLTTVTGGAGGRGGNASGGASTGGVSGAGGKGGAGGASGGAGGGQAGSGAVTTPEALVPTVSAFCAAARACCANQPDPPMLTDCESSFGSKSQTAKSLATGAVTIDAAGLSKCLAAYQAAATACEENSVLDACTGIVHGTRAEGQTCASGGECASTDNVCLITEQNGTTGVCKKVPRGKAGDECSVTCRPNDSCVFTVYGAPDSTLTPCYESDNLYCDYSGTPSKCKTILATNAACESDDQCGSLSYCDSGGSRTCKKRGQLNEACGMCIPALSCINGKCKSPPLSVGSTCEGYSLGPY